MTQNKKWIIVGKTMRFLDGIEISFPHEIKKVIASGEVLAVLVTPPHPVRLDENVFGVANQKIIWQVEPRDAPTTDWGCLEYVSISITDRGVRLYGMDGMEVYIDPKTGRILDFELIK